MSGQSCFVPKEWVCVVNMDKCKYSPPQLNVLIDIKKETNNLVDVIDCGDPANASVAICTSAHGFPAFCSKNDNKCVYGLKKNMNEIESACKIVKEDAANTRP